VRISPPSTAHAKPIVALEQQHSVVPIEQTKTVLAYAPPAAKPPISEPRPQPLIDHRFDGVLTAGEIARFKRALRLSPDQQPHWPPVEAVLQDIGRRQTAQVISGRKAEVDSGSLQRLYTAAQPLLAIMRPDQKEQVRKLARSLGFGSYASMI
jgi:hypothetical protein